MTSLPVEDAATLKCSKCRYYLNVPPIKTSVDGTVYQCGRCDFDDPKITVRNFAYEKIAKYMEFPCINSDCMKKISWLKVQQHEIECVYRTIPCPIIDCKDSVLCAKIIDHFNENHRSAIISDIAVRFHKLESSVDLGLLIHDGFPYFCMFCSNGKSFRISVYSLRSRITQKYTIHLFTLAFQNRKISLSGEEIVLFNERMHCLKCYSGTCDSALHRRRSLSKGNQCEMTTEIDVHSLRSILKTETVCSRVSMEVNKNLQDSIENCDVIRKITECAICKEYMLPPIHCCRTGHIICNNCQKKMPKCPTCLAPFISARNYAVEELCSNVIIPCQNTTCDFIGNLKDLHLHEENCDIKVSKSPAESKLSWKFG